MLGWMIAVFRKNDARALPAEPKSPHGPRLAIWQTGLNGYGWLEELARSGQARFLGFNGGYPIEYTAQAQHLLPRILDPKGPPLANPVWKMSLEDFLAGATPSPIGRTTIDHDVANTCAPDEWLIVEAWDES